MGEVVVEASHAHQPETSRNLCNFGALCDTRLAYDSVPEYSYRCAVSGTRLQAAYYQ